MQTGSFSLSWVDPLIVGLLAVGVLRGRKRGMSEELLDIIKWTLIVVFAGLLYEPSGRFLSQFSVVGLLSSYLFAYLAIASIIFTIFLIIKRKLGEKLIGSDTFGSGEYYLGMAAGAYRYLCVLLVAMAFLNARHYTPAEIAASDHYQDQNFGTKLVPSVADIQKEVFERSLSGRAAHTYLQIVFIRSTEPSTKGKPAGSPSR